MACNYNIKVVEGNTFALVLPLKKRTYVSSSPIDEDIVYADLQDVVVKIGGMEYAYTIEENGVQVIVPPTLMKGTYDIVLTATYHGSDIRAAYFDGLTIVAYNQQSDAQQYLPGSPIVLDAAYIIGGTLTDAELEALKEEYREKNAQLQQAIADAEEAKREWEEKAADLDGVAQEATSQEILNAVENIDIDTSDLAKQGTNPNANISDIQAEIEAISPDIILGKQQLAAAITGKGVATQTTDPLATMAGNVQAIQNINKEFNVSDISQGWLGIPGTLELIAQYYDAQYPYAQAYILAQGASVTAITGCKRIVYSDGGSVVSVDNPSGSYTIGAYSDEVTIGFALLMFDTPAMQNAPISSNANVFEFGCKDATIEFGGMNSAFVRMCRFDGCDITMQASALQSSRICIFDIGNSDITISSNSTFYGCTQLQSVSLPNVTTISGSNTFYGCNQLQSVSLPNVTTISGGGTFISCASLQSVSLPDVTTISGGSTFYGCNQLQSVSLPNVTTISGSNTFNGCTQLQSVSLPNVTTISGGGTFVGCTQLQSVSLPNVTTISGSNTFIGCPNLIDIELGAAIEASFSLSTWNPTNVLADQTKKAQMLQNIREHIAANLPDRTGLSPLTVTFSAAVKAAILADQPTADAFTNKKWIIA